MAALRRPHPPSQLSHCTLTLRGVAPLRGLVAGVPPREEAARRSSRAVSGRAMYSGHEKQVRLKQGRLRQCRSKHPPGLPQRLLARPRGGRRSPLALQLLHNGAIGLRTLVAVLQERGVSIFVWGHSTATAGAGCGTKPTPRASDCTLHAHRIDSNAAGDGSQGGSLNPDWQRSQAAPCGRAMLLFR